MKYDDACSAFQNFRMEQSKQVRITKAKSTVRVLSFITVFALVFYIPDPSIFSATADIPTQ